jgi:hypothetical protein
VLTDWAYALVGPNKMVWGGGYPSAAGRPRGLRDCTSLPLPHVAPKPLFERRAMLGGDVPQLVPKR